MNIERVVGMVGKEFRQIFRDPRMARVIFVAPVIQLIVFSYAVSTDISKTATMVVDHDRTRRLPRTRRDTDGIGLLRGRGALRPPRRPSAGAGSRGRHHGVEIPPNFLHRASGTGRARRFSSYWTALTPTRRPWLRVMRSGWCETTRSHVSGSPPLAIDLRSDRGSTLTFRVGTTMCQRSWGH